MTALPHYNERRSIETEESHAINYAPQMDLHDRSVLLRRGDLVITDQSILMMDNNVSRQEEFKGVSRQDNHARVSSESQLIGMS